MSTSVRLGRETNQALGLGEFAIAFMKGELGPGPSEQALERVRMFHTDSVLCGLSALALGTNAPTVLRKEALEYESSDPCHCFGSTKRVKPEKAVVANCAAVREWDSNGTNFGYNPALGHTAGEFGHNDFYPVVIAACQQKGLDGATALRAMLLLDEIRGRLAEVFSLKSYKIDHVVHGGIASAVVYGALMGATAEQIESAIGMLVAHYVPWRAIRAGKQLSDSKGASAALTTEAAVLSMKRAMAGFVGPCDVFRNPEAIFRYFEPTTQGRDRWKEHGDSPFDLVLTHSGDDFAVMGMHFKLGLYEHQSAGALQAIVELLAKHPTIIGDSGGRITGIKILAYEPAFGIIGNPAKMDPKTRQSADHSMAYIVATFLRKAIEFGELPKAPDEVWKALMLTPYDYEVSEKAIFHPLTRSIMSRIEFLHGGPDYDAKYPDGIPTSVHIEVDSVQSVIEGGAMDVHSGVVMYPAGHARNTTADLAGILRFKWEMLGKIALQEGGDVAGLIDGLEQIGQMDGAAVSTIYSSPFGSRAGYMG